MLIYISLSFLTFTVKLLDASSRNIWDVHLFIRMRTEFNLVFYKPVPFAVNSEHQLKFQEFKIYITSDAATAIDSN